MEIERKFLVKSEGWREAASAAGARGVRYRQGYLAAGAWGGGVTVRARTNGKQGFLTVKGPTDASGVSRAEYEYEVPEGEAAEMIALCGNRVIEKTRYRIPVAGAEGLVWEVDEYHGENTGLVVAEIELPAPGHPFPRPAWMGREVTREARFRNSELVLRPWGRWNLNEKRLD